MEDDRLLRVIVRQTGHPQHDDLVIPGGVRTLDGALEMNRASSRSNAPAGQHRGADTGEALCLVLGGQLPDDVGVALAQNRDAETGQVAQDRPGVELCCTANITRGGGSWETPTAKDEATMTVGSGPDIPASATTPVGKAPNAFRSSVLSIPPWSG